MTDLYSSINELEPSNGRSVIPRRLPPVPSLPSLRTPSTSTSTSSPSSLSSLSPASSSDASTPASSPGSVSPNHSPAKALNALKRVSRPLPPVPSPCGTPNPTLSRPTNNAAAQLIVCRSCMNCVTTSETLLPASAVPAGSRAFRGFSGKASLFTECYNVTSLPPRVQLMTTGAHTMQETFCANCSTCLGWKIVKAHERTEKWKEGNWLLELESLWLARSSDVLDSSFEKAVEREREREQAKQREAVRQPRRRRGSEVVPNTEDYPKHASRIVREAREQGLGLDFGESEASRVERAMGSYPNTPGIRRFSKSTPSFRAYGSVSAIHLPMTVAS
ncbi:hypothetical protein AN958_03820 [Leucoagaricus sp. SymC.cos]|nr:hypothetical protein AN958_03820 [Leucoagaricus sp. SymC.cos]